MLQKRKILGWILSVCCLFGMFGFSACHGGESSSDSSSGKQVDLTQVMKIGTFNDPFVTKEAYEKLAESGINWVVVNKTRTHSQVLKVLDYCDELDIDVLVMSKINNKTLNNNEYMEHKSFAGINMQDEPVLSDFTKLAEMVNTIEEKYPGKLAYSNLFPDPESNVAKLGTETYEQYIDEFCKQVLGEMNEKKVLSFDIYPLETILGEHTVQSRYCSNLELIAKYAKQYNAEPHVYLQSICYANRRIPTLEDLNFQVYCAFAFGYRALNWFAYYTPGPSAEFKETDIGIVDRDGNPTELYDRVKAMNEEIFKFDGVYLSYIWDETIPVYGKEESDDQFSLSRMENQNETVEGVSKIVATYDALVGRFERDGDTAYMVTNFREPRKEEGNEVTLTFEKAKKVKVWINGEAKEISLNNHKLTLSLPAGEGAFVEVI